MFTICPEFSVQTLTPGLNAPHLVLQNQWLPKPEEAPAITIILFSNLIWIFA
jgi:hypothetical protein